MSSSATGQGFAAWVDAGPASRFVLPWQSGLAPGVRALSAGNLAYALSFVLALAAPVVAIGRAHAFGALAILGESVAFAWFVWGLDAAIEPRHAYGVARWPGLTAAICGAGALGARLAHGRGGVVVWLMLWTLPGVVQLLRYAVALGQRADSPGRKADRAKPALSDAYARARAAVHFTDDPNWYASDWRAESGQLDMGTAGYRLELLGGPLAGRTARLRDSRFRLWITQTPDGPLAARGALEKPADIPTGAHLIGAYAFSHGDEAMTWTPAERS